MRVVLVGPDRKESLSLRYLSSSLAEDGHSATIATFDSAEDAEAVLIAAQQAELVGLSIGCRILAPECLALGRALKALRPDRPVVAGGAFASSAGRQLLSNHPEIDAIVVHEGEATLSEIAALDRITPSTLSSVRGVLHRANGNVIATPPRPIALDLDRLPRPDRSGPERLEVGVPTRAMMGSRGSLAMRGMPFRQRSPENIALEMAHLYHERAVRQFIFYDDSFLVVCARQNLERLDALDREMRLLGVRGAGLTLKCRPPEVDRDVLSRLGAMGLVSVLFETESSPRAGLASIGICEELGIATEYTIILFHPEATPAAILEDLAFVREHPAHAVNLRRADVYPRAPLERHFIDTSRASGNYLTCTYGYADRTTALVWSCARELLRERCFGPNDLLGQLVELRRLVTVLGHFYQSRRVAEVHADCRSLVQEVNLDTVTLLEDLVRSCMACADRPTQMAGALDALRAREASSRRVFVQRMCTLHTALHDPSLASIGHARSGCGELGDADVGQVPVLPMAG